jgi:transposase
MLIEEKEYREGERTAVGIDPCKEFLQLAILSPDGKKEFKKLPLSPSITEEIAKSTVPEKTQIGIESYGSYGKLFVFELLKKGYDVREVNPSISNKLTSLVTEDHSDCLDAISIAKALVLIPDLPKVSFTEQKLLLAKLSRLRKRLLKDLNGYLNRLHVALTESYGAVYKRLFRSIFSQKALGYFERYPTINDAFCHKKKVTAALGEEKWDLLSQAGKWDKSYYLECLKVEIRCLIGIIKALLLAKKELEKKIKEVGAEDEDVKLLRSFPGIDYVSAATLLSEIGNVERFEKESCLSSYCGVSPVMWQSGTSGVKARRRKRYNRHLKGMLYFISLSQIRLNPESRDYYWRKRKEGKTHWQAMNALSRQLIKIIYYMLTNRECYHREKIVH